MIIQIYEIQTPFEAEQMAALGVDHIGSVLLSPDAIQNAALKETVNVVRSLGRKSSLIPLFTDVARIVEMIGYYRPDIVHFCDTLPSPKTDAAALMQIVQRQQAIRKRFPGLEIMRSIPIGRAGYGAKVASLEMASLFEPFSDWFLTDTLLFNGDRSKDADQPVDGYVGITGKICDWDVAAALVTQSNIPVILAGGIGPENASSGVEKVRPAGVDSCTLTNALDANGKSIRFKKDLEKVSRLVTAAHRADDGIGRIEVIFPKGEKHDRKR
jgi:phosphoribosylanthranilate isomerase